jgi:hypothetical protein
MRGRTMVKPMRCAAAALVVVLAVSGCAGGGTDAPDADPAAAPGTSTEPSAPVEPEPEVVVAPPDGPLPPEDTAGLAVEAQLAALYAETGTLLTRGAVIERRVRLSTPSSDGYTPGTSSVTTQPHLALYLAFVEEDLDDVDRYVDAIEPLTRLFAGASFDRWPDLESFDICLVPRIDSDVDPQPAIVLIDVTREGYARWLDEGGDLEALLALAAERRSGVRLQLSDAAKEALAARGDA